LRNKFFKAHEANFLSLFKHILEFKPLKIWSWSQDYLYEFSYRLNLPHNLLHKLKPFSALTFGQKIKHKMRFDRRQLLTDFADKVAIKERVAKLIGNEYIVPTFRILDKAEDLKLFEYPREFVLKPSHGSGGVILVHEEAKRNLDTLKSGQNVWNNIYNIHPDDLNINLKFIKEKSMAWLGSIYAPGIEFCYSLIPPKLIIEKYLKADPAVLLSDFRMYTFHGKVRFFRAAANVANDVPAFAYDEFGSPLNIRAKHDDHNFQGPHPILPKQYVEMIRLAEILAGSVDFVRVDLYLIGDQIYFSEMTNYPLGGDISFKTNSFEKLVSAWWTHFDGCTFK